jgi:meso-butanediol dehydrogenase/(S,S)-butanediol dehydrogenase/diacetyl reductase
MNPPCPSGRTEGSDPKDAGPEQVYHDFRATIRPSRAFSISEATQMELKGKNAIVTGSARGIGRGIALKLAQAGANIACVDLGNQSDKTLTYNLAAHTDLLCTVDEIKRCGVSAVAMLADVTNFADCRRMADETVHQLGSIDILVNNAGIIAVGPVADFSEEQWDRVMAVNAKGPFLCCKACIPYMLRNKEGAIINTASIAGKTGRGGASAYSASKFAVIAFTQALAEELGPSNIRVNAVCPGFLRTAMWTDVLNKVPGLLGRGEGDGTADNLTYVASHRTYLRREQTPEDIGNAVVYLACADNITGEALNIAGGAEVH